MNKAKAAGTAFESWLVNHFQDLGVWSRRLPEGGSLDLGDLEVIVGDQTYFVEAKARERLNVTRELGHAVEKSGARNATMLIWKRLVQSGGKRRSPDGERIVVVMTLDMLDDLLTGNIPLDQ